MAPPATAPADMVTAKPVHYLAKNLLEFQSMYIDGCKPEILEGSVFTLSQNCLLPCGMRIRPHRNAKQGK